MEAEEHTTHNRVIANLELPFFFLWSKMSISLIKIKSLQFSFYMKSQGNENFFPSPISPVTYTRHLLCAGQYIFGGRPSGCYQRFCHLLGKHSSVRLVNSKSFPQLQFVLQSEQSVRRPYVGLGTAGVIDFDRLLICWYQSGNDVSVYL